MIVEIEYLYDGMKRVQDIKAEDIFSAVEIFKEMMKDAIIRGHITYICAGEKEIKLYPNYIMKAIRQNMGLEPDDESNDEEIMEMNHSEIFERWLQWQGILGFGDRILSVVEEIFGITLGKEDIK